MLYIKPGASLKGLIPQMAIAVGVVHALFERTGLDTWITSGNDSTHNGRPVKGDARDPHYEGKALDFRAHDIPAEHQQEMWRLISDALSDEWTVLLEFPGTPQAHYHVQYGHTA